MHLVRLRKNHDIFFDVPGEGVVTLEVFDVRGSRVRTLVSGSLPPGTHHIDWTRGDGDWPSGVYFVRLTQGAASVNKKVILLK